MEDLEKRVEELNSRHSTESVSLVLEKKIVAQIDFLNGKGRDFINSKEESYQAERAAKEQRVISRKRLDEERNQLDTQIDAAKGKLDKQRLVVDKIRAEQDSKMKKLQESTPDVDRDAEKKTINELKSVVRKLRDNFQDELDKWYLNERIHFEQQKIARKKKAEAMQAERDQRRKEWEAEQAQYPEPDPYQEEKDMCDGLILYTRTLLGETVEKPSVNLAPGKGQSAPTLKTTTNTREITAEGKAIGKSSFAKNSGFDNLLFSDFVQKSGKKGKKARRAAALSGDTSAEAGDTPLKPHSIDYIAAFATLDITPPNKMGEVRAALEAVLAKKAYYDSKPKPTDEEKAQMAAEKSKKRSAPVSEKKPKSKAVDIMNGDATAAFPGLGADKSTVSPSPTAPVEVTRPTACYSAAVKGSAPAPSPIVPAQSDLAPQVGALDEVATEAVMESGEATVANDVGKEDLLTSAPDASVTNA
ncbi:unnamed protein product [Chondrus crispus]|uniref:Uncharacterized protein n=1 Tax=Chondrus crispus TaxID=2769 RepID=R7QJZ2_CHOCR|nr:unnamed protein product [Chondrus crispus]CDF38842.1 unnamed protein product [Chondrus crispus]|eukprot:XP_005718747.1 unnamed protein product [Chondrus crispus]